MCTGTRIRPSKLKQQTSTEDKDKDEKKPDDESKADQVELEIVDQQQVKAEPVQEIKDSWDAESSEDEPEDGWFRYHLF